MRRGKHTRGWQGPKPWSPPSVDLLHPPEPAVPTLQAQRALRREFLIVQVDGVQESLPPDQVLFQIEGPHAQFIEITVRDVLDRLVVRF